MIGHWWLFGRKWRSLLQKRKLGPPNTEGPQEIWNIPRPWLQQTKKFSPPQKNYLWVGGVIIMKGDQKWEIVEVTIGIFFFVCFCLRFTIFYTGSFQVPHKKITPTYSASSHLKSQFDLSLSYMNVWKMAQSHPPPITQGGGGVCKLWLTSFLFISAFSGKPSGFPDYTLSQEKVSADVVNKIWFIISFRGKLKIGYLLSIQQSPV